MLDLLTRLRDATTNSTLSNEHIVAYRGNEPVTWQDLCRRRDYWGHFVAAIPSPAIALHQTSGVEFVAALLAIWQLGKIAVIPGSSRRAHLCNILNDATVSGINDCENFVAPAPKPVQTRADLALIIYTSGSSGAPQACYKSFIQLDAELSILEQCWSNTVAGSLFVSSVSRHHMYGLPFGLLWPLCRGDAFADMALPYMESLSQLPCSSFTLITSPVQLANLPPRLNWTDIAQRCAAVFSAGAPLTDTAAKRSQENFGLHVNEIYGSTETGAIAKRQQLINQAWQSLPDTKIRVSTDSGHIEIDSLAAGTAAGEWLRLSDTAETTAAAPQQFILKGRSDQIVKVGAKRVSLSHINTLLESHPWVREARTVILNDRKSRIGAVLCLTADSNRLLTDKGRNVINKALSKHLSDQLESVARPRYWRYLAAMPSNSQGKVSRELLEDLFYSERQPRLPDVIASVWDGVNQCVSVTLFVPHQLVYFNGHFPGNAVLPGVVQISWVMHFAQQYFPNTGTFQQLEIIKFQQVLRPGDTVKLTLNWDRAKHRLLFTFNAEPETTYSSGRIGFKHHDE